MKNIILIFVASAFVSFTYAQDANSDIYKRIGSDKELSLSADQIAEIKRVNREIGFKFRAIGKSNLPGYEKGRRKRSLALERKAAIRKILNEGQVDTWEYRYGSMGYNDGLKDVVDEKYDVLLQQLERDFEQEKEAIEDGNLPKEMKKNWIKLLKNEYKAEKERLKHERNLSRARATGEI